MKDTSLAERWSRLKYRYEGRRGWGEGRRGWGEGRRGWGGEVLRKIRQIEQVI
jgi:hypothetical protein